MLIIIPIDGKSKLTGKTRRDDTKETNGANARSLLPAFDRQTIAFIIVLLLGGSGGSTAYHFLLPNRTQSKNVESRLVIQEQKLNTYIQTHEHSEGLQKQIIDNDIKYIREKLDDMKDDLKEIKHIIKNGGK